MAKPIVLVVDDDAELRRTIGWLLERDCELVEAADGLQALERAKARKPDLVILDIIMPVLAGLETLSALKGAYPELPVVMLTSEKDVDLARQALAGGAVAFITKPFDAEFLRAEVSRLLGGRPDGRADRPWKVAKEPGA